MSLSDDVTDRYPEQTLAELSNPSDTSAKAVVASQLARAVTAIEDVYFPMYVQVAYDDTLPTDGQKHIEVAVMGVVAMLRIWANPKSDMATKAWEAWIAVAEHGSRTFGGRKRVVPSTTSTYSHKTQDSRRPEFDVARFEDQMVNPPGGDSVDD